MKFFLNAFLFIFSWSTLFAQADTVYLENPSFEGVPYQGDDIYKNHLPKGWDDCGFTGETPPDVHPVYGGSFQVNKPPSRGKTYLGMVTRDNDTWERVSTNLSSTLKKGQCYSFSIDLARSEIYTSYSRIVKIEDSPARVNYVQPLTLRIYGGNSPCDRAELLGTTSLIRNSRWLSYTFIFQPEEDVDHLVLEAFYVTPTLVAYNGNILLDNASPLIAIPCDEGTTPQNHPVSAGLESGVDYEKGESKTQYGISQTQRDSIDRIFKKRNAKAQARRDSIRQIKQQAKEGLITDFNKLVVLIKLSGESIDFSKRTAELGLENFELIGKNHTAKSGLNEIFNLVKSNPKLSLLIGVKKKDSKETQAKRIEKLKTLVKAAGLNEDAVLIRKKNKIKWSYPWDAENGDLVFYVFDPEN